MRLDLMLQHHSPASDRAYETIPPPCQMPENAQDEFDQLLDTLYDATILTDHDGKVITANRRAFDFFQTDIHGLRRTCIDQLIAGADQTILETVLQNIAVDRFTLMQAYCVRADQSTFAAEISVTSVVRNGQLCLCFSIRDITVRREMDERLRIEGEAIRNAGDGIVITDTDGIITYANPAVGRLWNIQDQESLIGETILTLFPSAHGIEDAVNAAVQTGSWNGEIEAQKAENLEALYLQTDITASLDENDDITHLVFSFADITRRRQGEVALMEYQNHLEDLIHERTTDLEATNQELLHEVEERRAIEEKLREAIRQLREHDKSKSVFVSNVSHELRTPLTSLINSLENLMRGVVGKVPAPVASYFNMMLEDCWRLERTINDILDLSRIEKGTFQLVRHPVPFAPLIRRTAEAIRMSAEAIPLHYKICHELFPGFVDCDSAKIERVLMNVLSNALKFTQPHGDCSILFKEIRCADKPALACEVIDSGVGIPPALIDRVTERFFRVGEQVEGTGLGLAIAREIIEKHGGGLEIQSPPPDMPHGTLVRIWLPKLPAPHLMIALPEGDRTAQLHAALAQHNYQITLAHRGADAVQRLRDSHFAAALIGANLIDMSGTEAIMHIMADATIRNVKLFYLTEAPIHPEKAGLLQGFQIPHLMLGEDLTLLTNKMEIGFLPLSRTHNGNHVASVTAATSNQGGSA